MDERSSAPAATTAACAYRWRLGIGALDASSAAPPARSSTPSMRRPPRFCSAASRWHGTRRRAASRAIRRARPRRRAEFLLLLALKLHIVRGESPLRSRHSRLASSAAHRTADESQREGDFPAFWSGLPLVLGVAGALLGYAGRNAASGARLSIAAFVVGLLSSIGYVAIYVIDFLGQSGVG